MEQRHHKFILFFALILVLVVRCLYAILRLIVPSNEFQDVPAYSQPYLYQVVVTIFAIATTLRFAYQLRNARWNARLVATDEKVAVWSQLWFATLVVFYTEGTFTTATIGLLALFPILGSHFSAPNAAIAVTSIISSIIVLLVDLNAFYDVRVAVVQDEEIPLLHRFVGFCVTLLTIWMCTLRFEALIQVEQRRFNSVTDFVVDLLDQIASFDMEGLTELLSANAGKEFITAELDYVARACLKNMSHLRPYLPANLIPNEQKELDPDDLAMAQDAGDDDEPGDLNDYVGQGKSYAAEEDSTQLATVLRLRSCTILAIECTTQRKASAADIAARSHQFLTVVLEQISRNDGVVNTMTPFAVVASFNGQSPCQRHAKRASSAALGIVSKLKNVVLDPPLEAFIAIDTRENIAGVCGVDRQLARVVAGEGVLLAQRLVGLARYLRTPIIISHEAAMEVNSQFSTVPIDVVCPTWPYGYSGEGPAATTDLVVYELRSRRIDNSLEAYIAAFHEFRGGRIAGALGNLSLYSELRKDEREFHARRLESICRAMAADQTIRPTMVRQDIGWERFRGEADVLSAESARPRLQEPADDATHVGTREPEEMNFRETIAELQPAPETKGEEKTDGLIDMFVFGSPSDDEGDTPAPVAEAGGQNESGGVEEQLPRTFEDDVHMEKWLLSQKCLGSGSFSAVHLGMSVEGLLVAMKVFSLRAKQTNTRLLGEEVERMRRLSHHNIVSYISCALRKNSGHFIIVMEYVSGGSLKNILETFGPPPLTAIRKYVTDLLRGLKYLHENGIIHCDVKPHNALLTSDGSCKLSDFGSAVNVTLYKGEAGAGGAAAEDVMVRGTSYYLAPEACRNEITSAVDIWSVGITVLELMTGRLPWDFKGGEAAFIRELGKNPNFMPVIPGDIPANAASFCKRCLNRSPEQRPTADELLRSPFLGS